MQSCLSLRWIESGKHSPKASATWGDTAPQVYWQSSHMEPRHELLRVPFSTADAEYPRVITAPGSLRVAFRDWREKHVELLFYDVVAFSWDEGDVIVGGDHRDDCSYIFHDSPWLERHFELGTMIRSEDHRHFKLCFNAIGVLQVLASRIEVLDELAVVQDGGGNT